MLTVDEYKTMAEKIYSFWQKVYTSWGAMEDMSWKNKKHLIDLMFDGTDENGRPYGVYIKNIGSNVFEYEIYGRFSAGSKFMKKDDFDYLGEETEPIQAEWERKFQDEKAAYRSNSKSYGLKMGGTRLELVTSCVSSRRSSQLS